VVLSLCQNPEGYRALFVRLTLTPTIGPIFGIGVPTPSSAAMVESLRGLDRGGMFWRAVVAEVRFFRCVRELCSISTRVMHVLHFFAHPHRYLITGNIHH